MLPQFYFVIAHGNFRLDTPDIWLCLQKHSQIRGLVVKYLKSDFRAILGQLRVRLVVVMDDMLIIIHRMRF